MKIKEEFLFQKPFKTLSKMSCVYMHINIYKSTLLPQVATSISDSNWCWWLFFFSSANMVIVWWYLACCARTNQMHKWTLFSCWSISKSMNPSFAHQNSSVQNEMSSNARQISKLWLSISRISMQLLSNIGTFSTFNGLNDIGYHEFELSCHDAGQFIFPRDVKTRSVSIVYLN